MHSCSVLVVIASAMLAICTPLPNTPNTARIPLSKRGSFVKENRYFDPEHAKRDIAFLKNKYSRNEINYRRNVGSREAFNDDSVNTDPLAAPPAIGSSFLIGDGEYDVEYHSMVLYEGQYWQISNASCAFGQNVTASGFKTNIDRPGDPTTPLIIGPPDQVDSIYSGVKDVSFYQTYGGMSFYQYPCKSPPDFKMSWEGGKWWSVTAEKFSYGETKSGSGICIGSLIGMDTGFGPNVWDLGTSFLESVVYFIDTDKMLFGFAERT